jgi:tetratricopeptide (TPR) repeat protein
VHGGHGVQIGSGNEQVNQYIQTYIESPRSPAVPVGALLPAPLLDVQVRGRDDVVAELAELASAPDGRVQVLVGMGGSGKSTVARAVAARVTAGGGQAWWVSAGDAVSATQLLLGLARALGASASQVDEALAGRVNPSDVLWGQLEAAQGWVLVLDNADDLAALAVGGRSASSGSGWLRPTRAGLVLVTSRAGDRLGWGPAAKVRQLKPLDGADGAQVLLDLAPRAGDELAARSLSARLGGLPLALHHAGNYMASPFAAEVTFAAYEVALSERFGELMSRGDDDRAKVIMTWELSAAALRAQGIDHAETLLRILSCFASSVAVPALLLDRDLLESMCGTKSAVEAGLSGLLSVGQIDIVEPAAVGPPDVKVHPLVAETVRYQAGDDLLGSVQQAVELFAIARSRLRADDPEVGAQSVALLPHLQALQLTGLQLPAEAESSLAGTAVWVSMALLWGGQYVAAFTVADAGLRRRHNLASDHPAVLDLQERRAAANEFLAQYAEAEAEYQQVLDAKLRVLGPDHPSTLTARFNFAQLLVKQGKLAEAEAKLRQVLDAQLRVLEPDHPSALATRSTIATILRDQGKFAEADAEYRQALAARLRVRGPDDPSTLTTRNNIAQLLSKQGKLAEAEAEYRQVLAGRLRVLGPDHPSTLTTRTNIATVLSKQGKLAEAEAENRQALAAKLRVLGPEHPSTLVARGNIATVLVKQGKLAEAEAEYRQVLAAMVRVLGPEHPNTLTIQRLLQQLQDNQRSARDRTNLRLRKDSNSFLIS